MINLSEYDRQVYEEIRDFLPDRIIDCHTHVWLDAFYTSREAGRGQAWVYKVASECSVEELVGTYRLLFPGKSVTPVLFGATTNVDYNKNIAYVHEQGQKLGFPHLLNSRPDMTPDKLEAAFDDDFAGLKPYLSNAPAYIPEDEIRIFDFLPHAQLAVANRRKAAVMLHLPRRGRLKDPVNIAQLLEIEQQYPDVRLIVAHVGRAYAPEDFGDAFSQFSKTTRMMFDFSANALDTAIQMALDTFGPKRVLFGSDMPISIMRMRRTVENGSYINIVPPGLYGDLTGVAHMREAPVNENLSFFLYEIVRAAKRAMRGYSKQDVEDVFYNNARTVFGVK